MLIALLAVLGDDLIMLVIVVAGLLARRAGESHQPGAFRGAIRAPASVGPPPRLSPRSDTRGCTNCGLPAGLHDFPLYALCFVFPIAARSLRTCAGSRLGEANRAATPPGTWRRRGVSWTIRS